MGQCNTNTKEDGAADDYSEDFLADGAHVRIRVPNFDNKKIDVDQWEGCAVAHKEKEPPDLLTAPVCAMSEGRSGALA